LCFLQRGIAFLPGNPISPVFPADPSEPCPSDNMIMKIQTKRWTQLHEFQCIQVDLWGLEDLQHLLNPKNEQGVSNYCKLLIVICPAEFNCHVYVSCISISSHTCSPCCPLGPGNPFSP
jgi:hypothetical protein